MTGAEKGSTTVVMPLTLTDFTKAFRELLATFRDAVGICTDGVDLLRRRRARSAAGQLSDIGFPPGGFCKPLGAVARGGGSDADVDELARLFDETSERVAERVHDLRAYRSVVREQCGAAAGNSLDKLLDGPNGKFVIRWEIEGLVHMWRDGRAGPERCREQAARVLSMIDAFNEDLATLHDAIFPPRGAPR